MKLKIVFLCLAAFVFVADCRKIKPTIDKNANLAFINNEGGGAKPPAKVPAAVPANSKPLSTSNSGPAKVDSPNPTPPSPKPTVPAPKPTPASANPLVTNKPALPAPVKPVPQNPLSSPSASTPGPKSVAQLINYYDSQGKASPIRPYSYSQAVKQG